MFISWYPLHFSAQKGHLAVVEYLVNHGALINPTCNDADVCFLYCLQFIGQL